MALLSGQMCRATTLLWELTSFQSLAGLDSLCDTVMRASADHLKGDVLVCLKITTYTQGLCFPHF